MPGHYYEKVMNMNFLKKLFEAKATEKVIYDETRNISYEDACNIFEKLMRSTPSISTEIDGQRCSTKYHFNNILPQDAYSYIVETFGRWTDSHTVKAKQRIRETTESIDHEITLGVFSVITSVGKNEVLAEDPYHSATIKYTLPKREADIGEK